MNEDLPTIYNEDDWSNLKVGDKALLKGNTKFKHGDTYIPIRQPDWTDIVVLLTDEGGAQLEGKSFQTSRVTVIVERTEDGLQTSLNDVVFSG